MKDEFARNRIREISSYSSEHLSKIKQLESQLNQLERENKELEEDLKTGIDYLREAVAALYAYLDVKFVKTTEEIGTVNPHRAKLQMEERVIITAKKSSKN